MKYIISTLCIMLSMFSCKNEEEKKANSFIPKEIKEVIIEESLTDSTLNVRAFQIFEDGTLTFAGANNTYGMLEPNGERWLFSKQDYDSLKLEFRAVGKTTLDFFMMSVGSPALVFKTGDSGKMELVYKEDHEKAFYDSMAFGMIKKALLLVIQQTIV
ncbi:hypothetical protein [Lacinutrix neustonica]|uniref:hypothetical protein n=1 Tax=Lacinutrix neustonica TaxID=2980107 RepID=UPI0028BE30E9|nr:hypothetical protein [Lacinutrix neustonica]